jgi:hypothetical protein
MSSTAGSMFDLPNTQLNLGIYVPRP